MALRSRRLVLNLVALAAFTTGLRAQVSGRWSGCRTDSLSTYNCAQYYSGTVTLTSELKGPNVSQSLSVVATVTAGRVSCRVKGTEAGEFEGAGMLAVEHESTENAGGYTVSVWCPGAAGERPTRDDSPAIQTYDQRAADYATLDGRDAHEHPDADAANGLAGTETITWKLRR